ncbi:MAG TPA: hypothetical protein VFF02_18505, partial [Anaeromyxobacteraceae bacterium]|nr:hypothetical protein [Anaeromyxobacteraceae bacterium]
MTPSWKDRLFTPLQLVLTLALFAEAALVLGLAVAPAAALWLWVRDVLPLQGAARLLVLSVAGTAGYFVFGLSLLVVIPVVRWLTFAVGTPVGR